MVTTTYNMATPQYDHTIRFKFGLSVKCRLDGKSRRGVLTLWTTSTLLFGSHHIQALYLTVRASTLVN